MLALLCCRRCGSVNWDGGDAEGASATRLEEPPPIASTAACRGGRARAEHVRHRPGGIWLRPPPNRGGERRRGNAQLLRAAEKRLKTSKTEGGGSLCRGGWWGGGDPRGTKSAPVDLVVAKAEEGTRPGLSPPPPLLAGVRRDLLPTHPLAVGPLTPGPAG